MEFLGKLLGGDVAQVVVGHDAPMVDDYGAGAHGFHLLHDVGGE